MKVKIDKPVENSRKINGPTKFLLAVAIFYLLLYLLSPEFFNQSLNNFISLLTKVIPVLFIVFLAMFLTNLLIKEEKIRKYLGKEAGLKGWLITTAAGILISGPPYLLYPMLGDLKKQGASNSLLAVFLYNRNVKIPFIPVMIFYFGWAYTIIVSFLIIIFSFINGKIIGIMTEKKD